MLIKNKLNGYYLTKLLIIFTIHLNSVWSGKFIGFTMICVFYLYLKTLFLVELKLRFTTFGMVFSRKFVLNSTLKVIK